MSYGMQIQSTAFEFVEPVEGIFAEESMDTSLPDGLGTLKGSSKAYQLSTTVKQNIAETVKTLAKQNLAKLNPEKPSPMHVMSSVYRQSPEAKSLTHTPNTSLPGRTSEKTTENGQKSSHNTQTETNKHLSARPEQTTAKSLTKQTHLEKREIQKQTDARREKVEQKNHDRSLTARQWAKEETRQWWEARYTQKHRQGGGNQQQEQQNQEKEDKKLRITKSASASSKNGSSVTHQVESGSGKIKKPELAPPKVGVFALYYILTKIGIFSDGTSNFSYKKEIEFIDQQTTETHTKRLEELKTSIKKEKETERWGMMVTVFSWVGSFMGLITGAALIATGVGAVAGALLIVGSVIQIANQVMEILGGWKKIAELLPGDDPEKKRAVISWMQIGIAVLCLVLAGVGVMWGGFASFSEAQRIASAMIGGIAHIGSGVTTIGEGISNFMYRNALGEMKIYDIKLAQLKHLRQDLMDKVEWGVDRLEQLFEDLAKALEFEEELFLADQILYRR